MLKLNVARKVHVKFNLRISYDHYRCIWVDLAVQLCSFRNDLYLSHRRDVFLDLPTPTGNSSQTSYIYLNFFGLPDSPIPQEIPFPSMGGVWMFSGTAHLAMVVKQQQVLTLIQTSNLTCAEANAYIKDT